MTRDEILKLEAGRELDALIAEKVIGWTRKYMGEYGNQVWDSPNQSVYLENAIPHYGTDIAAAWEVVEKIGGELTLAFRGKYWFCDFGNQDVWEYSQSTTPSLAICRAALLAVMESS